MIKASPEQLEKIGAMAAGLVRPGDRVGLGSGKAALAFVRALGSRVRADRLRVTGRGYHQLADRTSGAPGRH